MNGPTSDDAPDDGVRTAVAATVTDTRRAYPILFVATGCYTCLMFVWFSLPAYLPTIIDDLDLTSTQAGVVAGAIPLTYIPLALVSGLTVDRFGPGRTLAAGVVVYGVGQLARSTAPDFLTLLAATFLIGVGATVVTFGLPKLVSVCFPPQQTGVPSSIYLVGAAVGTGSAFALGRPYLGPALGGWRELFFWSGVVAVTYGILWGLVAWRARIDRRAAAANHAEATDETAITGANDSDATDFSVAAIRRDLRLILTHRELRLVVVVGTMYLMLSHGMQGWLPTILESRGLSAALAGQLTSLLVASYVVGILVVPAIADRIDARREALMACGLTAFGGVGIVLVVDTGLPVIVGILVAGIGVGGLSPLIRAIPPALEGIGARLTGTAVGFIFAVGEIGGFLGPLLVGSLHDVTGSFAPGLLVLAVGGLIVVLASGALGRDRV